MDLSEEIKIMAKDYDDDAITNKRRLPISFALAFIIFTAGTVATIYARNSGIVLWLDYFNYLLPLLFGSCLFITIILFIGYYLSNFGRHAKAQQHFKEGKKKQGYYYLTKEDHQEYLDSLESHRREWVMKLIYKDRWRKRRQIGWGFICMALFFLGIICTVARSNQLKANPNLDGSIWDSIFLFSIPASILLYALSVSGKVKRVKREIINFETSFDKTSTAKADGVVYSCKTMKKSRFSITSGGKPRHNKVRLRNQSWTSNTMEDPSTDIIPSESGLGVLFSSYHAVYEVLIMVDGIDRFLLAYPNRSFNRGDRVSIIYDTRKPKLCEITKT